MTDVTRFLKKALWLLPLPIVFFATSYMVDPANLFQGGKYEKGLATNLLEGKNVTNVLNCDDRLVQQYYISGLDTTADWLVLGSSHTMQIHSGHVLKGKLVNNSVIAAIFEDYLALFNLHDTHKGIPKKVVLCMDPWLFNAATDRYDWSSYSDEYMAMAKKLGIKELSKPKSSYKKYEELFSPDYFKKSYEFVKAGKSKKYNTIATAENPEDTKLADGSLVYSNYTRNADTVLINQKAGWYLESPPIFLLGGFTELSPRIKHDFNLLLDYLDKQHIEVVFFMAPYHPHVQRHIDKNQDKYAIVTDAEAYVRALGAQRNIPVIGSYNPNKLNLKVENFYDGTHCKTNIIDSLFTDYVTAQKLKVNP